jgi:hypothetical protein
MTEKPSFGFGASLAEIAQTSSTAERSRAGDLSAVDRAADRLGFQSREAPVRRRKRQPIDQPTDQINIRAAISDLNAFVEFCERKRYSYREGFAELVSKIDD